MKTWRLFALLAIAKCGGDEGLTPENTLARCGDDEDNDGDGFVDCTDQNCEDFTVCSGGDSDADSDTDIQEVPCAEYCSHQYNCGQIADIASCTVECDCEGGFIYRPEAGWIFFSCMRATDCADPNPEASCAELTRESVEPTETGESFGTACDERRARACGRLGCEQIQSYTDPVIETLVPCLEQDLCDSVISCMDAILDDAC